MSEPDYLLPPPDQHERNTKLIGGYTAFVSALLAVMVSNRNDWPRAWLPISLLALSLPSLVAYMLLDFVVRVVQGRKASAYRGLAILLGFTPSLAGITIVVGHFSWIVEPCSLC